MKALSALVVTAAFGLAWPAANAANRTATLAVPGMTCPACPITVKTALSRVTGVSDVQVSFEKKQAVVTFDDAKTSVGALTQATTNAGYPSTSVSNK